MKKRFEWARGVPPVVLAASVVTACQTVQTTAGAAVGAERRQSMMVSAKKRWIRPPARAITRSFSRRGQKNALNRQGAGRARACRGAG